MRNDVRLPDLTFPEINLGSRASPFDLKRWLYRRGACIPTNKVIAAIADGELGNPLQDRVELVTKIHEAIRTKILTGGSTETAKAQIKQLNAFFRWAEECEHPLELATVQTTYIHWTDFLLHRVRVVKDLKPGSAYTSGRVAGQILDCAIGRETPMLELTRLKEPKGRKSAQGVQAEKQNLELTFAFGRLMQDICDGLTLSALWGALPVRIPLSNGLELVQWSGLISKRKQPNIQRTTYMESSRLRRSQKRRAAYENDISLLTRSPLVNLRILAELLVFIGQTSMNLAQAQQLTLRHFSYASDVDGYKVRDYKARRGGEVLFEILGK